MMTLKNARYMMLAGALIVLVAAGLCLVAAPAGAASDHKLTSDVDFSKGELGGVVIKGTMEESRLELAKSDSWEKRAPAARPSARSNPAMATVYNADKVVLFGGFNGMSWLTDTWLYDQSDDRWSQMSPTSNPPSMARPYMAGLLNDDKVILLLRGSTYMDTWIYDVSDNNWQKKTAANPPPARSNWTVAALPGHDKFMMFGGDKFVTTQEFDSYNFPLLSSPGWSTGGNASWRSTSAGYGWTGWPYSGPYCAAAGCLTDNQQTWLALSVNLPGSSIVRFAWNVSSEANYDYLTFLIDGVEYARISGYTGTWSYVSFYVNEGSHTLTWRYSKDASLSRGSDKGWIDFLLIETVMSDTWIYDVGDNAWEEAMPPASPPGRANPALAPVEGDDKLVLFGGSNWTGALGDNWVYDISEQSWFKRAKPAATNRVPVLTSLGKDDKVMLFFRELTRSMFVYDVSEDRWTDLTSSNPPQLEQACWAALFGQDRVLEFGGIDASAALKDDSWLFRPYRPSGSLRSAALDLGGPSAPLVLGWTGDAAPGTTLRFQLRSALDEPGLASMDFVGPNGTKDDFYTVADRAIWSGHRGHAWMQILAVLESSDTDLTPTLMEISFSYNRIPDRPVPTDPADGAWTTDAMPTFSWIFRDADSAPFSFQWQAGPDASNDSVSFDSGEIVSGSASYIPARLPDGNWFWRVRTKDSDGAWSAYSWPLQIRIDTTAPTTACDAPAGWMTGTVPLTLRPMDDGIGVLRTMFRLDTGGWVEGTAVNVSGEGIHTLSYRSVDALGNEEPPGTVTVRIDVLAPSSSAHPLPEYSLGRTLTIYFTATDATSGLDAVSLMYRETEGAAFKSFGDFTTSPILFVAPGDGQYEFYTIAVDVAGNREAAPSRAQAKTTVDTTPPATAGNAPAGWVREAVELTLTASDNLGLNGTFYRLDGGDWQPYAGPFRISADGTHEVQYYSVDRAGNTETAKRAVIQKDGAPPVTSMAPLQTYQTSRSFYLFFNGSDAVSGLAWIEIWYRTSNGSSYQQLAGQFTISPVLFTATSDGIYEFYTVGKDGVGNSEAAPSGPQARTRVDTSAPTPSVALKDGSKTKSARMTLTGTVEPGSRVFVNDVEVAVDGQGGFTYAWKLYEGPNTVRITAVDQVGNSMTVTRTVEKVTDPPSFLSVMLPWILVIVILAVFLVVTLIALFRRPRQPARAASAGAPPPPPSFPPPPPPPQYSAPPQAPPYPAPHQAPPQQPQENYPRMQTPPPPS